VENFASSRAFHRGGYTRPSRPSRRVPGARVITYTSILLAILVGIVHAGLAPVIQVAGVYPDLILVAVVLVTTVFGFAQGLIWAFVGGLTANLLVAAPLGSLPLALLLVSAVVAGGGLLLGRLVWVYPVLAALVASVLADIIALLVSQLVGDPINMADAVDLILPAAVLNAAIAGLLLPFARLVAHRLGVLEERPAW
jgi:rod shape-determining protein MreD